MPRKPRFVAPGLPHHITQRGNNRQPVFFTEKDRLAWLERLFDYFGKHEIPVLAYCLMNNHVHIVAVPPDQESLAKAMGRLQSDFSRAANFLRNGCGHLWQERFYSSALDEAATMAVMAYVERNPVRAGMVSEAWRYPWSSAAVHLNGHDPADRIDLTLWSQFYTPERWREVLRFGIDEEAWLERLRQATLRGLPFGSDAFVERLGRQFARDLRMRPRGRPSKGADRLLAACT